MKMHPDVKRKLDEESKKHQIAIFAALDANPMLTGPALGQIANCKTSTARWWRTEYMKTHKEVKTRDTRKMNARYKETVFALLDKDPNLSAGELTRLLGYNEKTTCKLKKEYVKTHENTTMINFHELGEKYKEIIFALLDTNPHIGTKELQCIARCGKETARRHKKAWLELHNTTEQGEEPHDDASAS